MTARFEEDVPPPPYSETDIYSTSGGEPPRVVTADDASRSTSSTSGGDVIYTPPLTPQYSNFAGEVDDDFAGSPAAAYFATRPPPFAATNTNNLVSLPPLVVHSVALRRDTTPEALPYPSHLAARDVRPEDWLTFLNYLMPHYTAARNEMVVERKLLAEGIASGNNNNNNNNNNSNSNHNNGGGDGRGREVEAHAQAQLGRIRSPVDGGGAEAGVGMGTDPARRRREIEATVREWNDGFFAPRRVNVRVELEPPLNAADGATDGGENLAELPPQPMPDAAADQHGPQMPGAWRGEFDRQQPGASDGPTAASAAAGPSSRSRGFGGGWFGGGRGCGGRGGRGGFRWGGINVEADRVSIGDSFVADGRTGSVKIGGFVADENGISLNGRPIVPGRGWYGPPMHGRGRGGAGFGGGWGPSLGMGIGMGGGWRGCGGRGGRGAWGRGGSWWDPSSSTGLPPRAEDGGERGRAREAPEEGRTGGHRSRSSSVSSVSSCSSESSSVSSVESLPDYDDLRGAQLPVAKQRLQEWLHHPDQQITTEKVKRLKEDIKQAKHAPEPTGFDKTALRREVKELLRAWKDLKREQKRQRRQLKREKRQQRREERRERRRAKREMKRAARELRREEWRRGGPFGFPPHAPHSAPPAPPDFANPLFNFGPWSAGHHAAPPAGTSPNADSDNRDAHAASRAKYRAAAEIEAKLERKEAELLELHERIALQHEEQQRKGEKAEDNKKAMSETETAAWAAEKEIEALAVTLGRLRTEADEEYARELAEKEKRGFGLTC